jgi:hypothetical protein
VISRISVKERPFNQSVASPAQDSKLAPSTHLARMLNAARQAQPDLCTTFSSTDCAAANAVSASLVAHSVAHCRSGSSAGGLMKGQVCGQVELPEIRRQAESRLAFQLPDVRT